nr:aldo/keto reductase family oxidoreductase [uncultured bacterium]
MPTRTFGSTGRTVTPFGLGGEGVLRTFGQDAEAEKVIGRAIALGVTYLDTARAYDGSEAYYGRYFQTNRAARDRVFIASKTASRDAHGALRDLETTLANLRIESLDLWQLHDLRTEDDLRAIGSPGGALEAFVEAKRSGRVRHLGVTGHYDPAVLLKAVETLPIDSVLLPVNVIEGALGGFLTGVIPAARRRGMAVVGMKAYGNGVLLAPPLGLTTEDLLRYALAQDVDTVIVGCRDEVEVAENVRSASVEPPMSEDEQAELVNRTRKLAPFLAPYRGDHLAVSLSA